MVHLQATQKIRMVNKALEFFRVYLFPAMQKYKLPKELHKLIVRVIPYSVFYNIVVMMETFSAIRFILFLYYQLFISAD